MTGSTRLAIVGATGRMGRELIEAATERDDVTVPVAASRTPEEGPVAGHALDDVRDLQALYERRNVDVLVDFTAPDASVEFVREAAETGVGAVVGTTGFDDEDFEVLDDVAQEVPLLRASNFSRGVQTLAAVVADAARALPHYDAEVIETHHNGKRDAPSGTAAMLVDEIERARTRRAGQGEGEAGESGEGEGEAGESGQDEGGLDRVYGREGDSPRSPDEIGVHSVRAGDVAGEHEVVLAGDNEVLSLSHRAGDRSIFAAGALDAARWIDGRAPGQYDYQEVLGL